MRFARAAPAWRALMAAESLDAIVVGAGPNGLSAAVELARNGCSVEVVEAAADPGGGARTRELTLPGYRHDVCSSVHPLAAASPFLGSLDLAGHGLTWLEPPVAAAHPLEDGPAVGLFRSVAETADACGEGARAYASLVDGPLAAWDETVSLLLGPPAKALRRPTAAVRVGLPAARSARRLASELGPRGAALVAGMAAHSGAPLTDSFTGGVALALMLTGHRTGWPVAARGSESITDALVAELTRLGGSLTLGRQVRSWDQLPAARVAVFATSAWTMAEVCADRLPGRYRRALSRFQPGPAAFKVDYALAEPIPWTDELCRRSATVHVGGTFAEIARAEAAVAHGGHAEHPFVLVAQPSVVDPSRAPHGRHTAWAYCHVPNGSSLDMTASIERQIERFAPGFTDVVEARNVMGPADLERYNPSYVGGDIASGAITPLQVVGRPTLRLDPYRTPLGSVYLGSASTPPGPGVHGMSGYHAARSALRHTLR